MQARFPQFTIRDGIHADPGLRVIQGFHPVLAQMFIEQDAHPPGQPGGGMDAVGHGCDRNILFLFHLRPEELPHAPGHPPMQFRDAVAAIRISQSQDGHAEGIAPGLLVLCQVYELVAAQAQFGPVIRKVFIHQPEWELIIAGRDRRMRGEDISNTRLGDSLLEGQALGHQFACPFQSEEGRVAFIHMPDARVIPQYP